MLKKFVSVVHRQRMDLTFDVTQRPYDYAGDVVGMGMFADAVSLWGAFVVVAVLLE